MSLLKLTLVEATEKLEKKEISSVELTNAYIESSKKADELNIYITKTFETALENAKKSDERRHKNQQLSPIDGIPIGIKDIFLTENERTTCGSKFLENFIAPYESTVTTNLKQAGVLSLGKLNMDEFAMGSANLTSYYGNVINPWKSEDGENRVPGGSSGGSSAAVAARAVIAATGTDTGGSIRQPASFTGIVGMKPTYGVCSRYGIIAFASSLDQAGPMTRTVSDNALLLQYMAGYDEKDSSMVPYNKPNYSEKIGKSIKGMKIGIPKEYFSEKLSEEIKTHWKNTQQWLEEEGAEIVEISLPHTDYALPVYYIVAPAEASSNLSRFDGIRYGTREQGKDLEEIYKNSRTKGWGEEVKRRILVGTYNLLTENFDKFIQAAKVRRLIANDFIEAFKKVDAILTPTTTGEAFSMSDIPTDPIEMYFNDIFTVTANLAGIPGISLPVGFSKNKLPIGMQLLGNFYKETELYQIAKVVEDKAQFDGASTFVKAKLQ
jgi:aspartyl-tRNA(Asn)/glutamyl-tRNA(Gln) amidotransferase subunit A